MAGDTNPPRELRPANAKTKINNEEQRGSKPARRYRSGLRRWVEPEGANRTASRSPNPLPPARRVCRPLRRARLPRHAGSSPRPAPQQRPRRRQCVAVVCRRQAGAAAQAVRQQGSCRSVISTRQPTRGNAVQPTARPRATQQPARASTVGTASPACRVVKPRMLLATLRAARNNVRVHPGHAIPRLPLSALSPVSKRRYQKYIEAASHAMRSRRSTDAREETQQQPETGTHEA